MSEFKAGDRIHVSGQGETEYVVADPEQCCERDLFNEGMRVEEVGGDVDECIPREWARPIPEVSA